VKIKKKNAMIQLRTKAHPLFEVGSTLRLNTHEMKRVRENSWNHLRNTLKVMYSTQTHMSLFKH